MDMTKDIFADQCHGVIALQKIAPTDVNFRLYKADWLGAADGRQVMAVTGAVFRHARRGVDKGKLSIMVPRTMRTAYVTAAEIEEFRARAAQTGATKQAGLAVAAGGLISRAVTALLGEPIGALPLDVTCPRCAAAVDWPCKRPSGAVSSTHHERWNAVGITTPAGADLIRDSRYQDKRQAARTRPALGRYRLKED